MNTLNFHLIRRDKMMFGILNAYRLLNYFPIREREKN